MVIAILLFGLIVGVMQIAGPAPVEQVAKIDSVKADVLEEARKVAGEPVASSRTASTAALAAPLPANTIIIDISSHDVNQVIMPRRDSNHDVVVDSGGQDKTVVVIGVLADDIDPARCLEKALCWLTEYCLVRNSGQCQWRHASPLAGNGCR